MRISVGRFTRLKRFQKPIQIPNNEYIRNQFPKGIWLLLFLFLFFKDIAHGYSEIQISQREPSRIHLDQIVTGPENRTPETASFFSLGFDQFTELVSVVEKIDLMKWKTAPDELELPKDPYNRKLQFGRWINDPNDDTCFNTRAKVLVRDSKTEVQFRERNRCAVDRGQWLDPYTSRAIEVAREVQIDHMVPLKNAYLSGAWRWDFKTRCLYANYLGEDFHLLSVDGIQNMSKGDRGPDSYLPPNESFTCKYLRNWLAVKLIWKLQMNSAEALGIKEAFVEAQCSNGDFEFSAEELRSQRKFIAENLDLCEPSKKVTHHEEFYAH